MQSMSGRLRLRRPPWTTDLPICVERTQASPHPNSWKFCIMKAVILAGGFGTRISEESHLRPKPMIEIGGKPILWHIMKIYSHYGINDFVICLGYKGYMIKEYFANYFLHMSDVTFDMSSNQMHVHHKSLVKGQKNSFKKAIVTLKEGDVIDFYSNI
jgi:NDP-sugar pyrophosphorylase family protein